MYLTFSQRDPSEKDAGKPCSPVWRHTHSLKKLYLKTLQHRWTPPPSLWAQVDVWVKLKVPLRASHWADPADLWGRVTHSFVLIWGQSADTARSWALIGPLWQWDDDDAQCEDHRGSHEHTWCWSTNIQTQVKVKRRMDHVINAESAADRRRRNWEDNAPSLVHTWETASAFTLSFLFYIHGEERADRQPPLHHLQLHHIRLADCSVDEILQRSSLCGQTDTDWALDSESKLHLQVLWCPAEAAVSQFLSGR